MSEEADWDLPQPVRARVLSNETLREMEESRSEPRGVLDSERRRLQEISSCAPGRGCKEGYVFHKAREEGLLVAYKHVLGSQSSAEDNAYGPQKRVIPRTPRRCCGPLPGLYGGLSLLYRGRSYRLMADASSAVFCVA
jgi:hypothetical protein